MNQLKFSVITPSYNQGKYIQQTIRSVISQNYPNFEHIIMDGGSTDNSIDIFKKHTHLIWRSEKDRGQAHALNKALELSNGDIICWLNSDDLLCKNAFDTVNTFFINNPDKYCIIGNLQNIDEYGNYLWTSMAKHVDYGGLLNNGQCVQQVSTFFRKEVFEIVGNFDETFHYTMDHDFWVRVAEKFSFYVIDKDLAKFRRYQYSKTGSAAIKFVNEIFRIKLKYGARLLCRDNIRLILMYGKEPLKKIPFLRGIIRRIKGKNPDYQHFP